MRTVRRDPTGIRMRTCANDGSFTQRLGRCAAAVPTIGQVQSGKPTPGIDKLARLPHFC